MTTGEKLRAAREAAGLTQEQLASRARCTQPTISALERGHYEPSLPVLRRLAQALGVPVSALIG
jgi:transcriptional regulator with XRE-family HTH domain